MKLHTVCRYIGLASGAVAGLLIFAAILRFYGVELLQVRFYTSLLMWANTFAIFGVFAMVVYIACKDKDKTE